MTGSSQSLSIEKLLDHRAWLRGLSRALVYGDQEADDLEQDAWLAALQAPPRHEASPRGWLATIMRRAAWRTRRRDLDRREREAAGSRSGAALATADVVARAELHERVVRGVLELPDPYRETLLLRFFEDLAIRDIAARMGAPVETVRSRLRRGLATLRSRMDAAEAASWRFALVPLAALPVGKGGAAAAVGALVMSKAKIASVVVLVAALSWVGWIAVRDRFEVTPDQPLAPVANERPVGTTDSPPRPREAGSEREAGVAIRPRSVVEPAEAGAAASGPVGGEVAVESGTGTIDVDVIGPDGAPLEGATVVAGDPEREQTLSSEDNLQRNFDHVLSRKIVHRGTTSSEGRVSFSKVAPAARLTIAASHPDLGFVVALGIPVQAGQRAPVILRYEPGVRFFGKVTDASMRPLAGAKVQVHAFKDPAGPARRLTGIVSGPDGSYRTTPIAGAAFHVGVTATGFYGSASKVRDVGPEVRERRVDIQLEASPTLRGKFVLADGRPARVADRLATLFEKGGPADTRQRLELLLSFDDPRDDPNFRELGHDSGRILEKEDAYEATPVSKGVKFLSLWQGPNLLGAAPLAAPDLAPDIVVDWSKAVVKRRGVVALVVRSEGSPVTRYEARISGPEGASMTDRSFFGHLVTAKDGRFRFDPLAEGRYELVVTADGFDEAKTTVDLVPDPEVTEVALDLVPAPRPDATASISGVVRGPSGAPLNGATVWLVPERAGGSADAVRVGTNAEGTFRFDRLRPDSYLAVAEPPQSARLAPAWTRATAQPSAGAIVLTLSAGVEINVEPEGTDGPLSVRIIEPGGVAVVDDVRSGTQSWGSPRPFRVAVGRYELQVFCPHFTSVRTSFVAEEGARVKVKLERESR